jgi:glycosyltransferase involved in cell wall biosynthesis
VNRFIQSGSVLGFDALWQQPARTEKHAYDLYAEAAPADSRVLYFGFPWASLIDGVNRGTGIGAELNQHIFGIEPLGGFDRVATVCQHIKFRDFIDYFKRVGITDLFASHAFREERVLDGINIHPFPLFPAQLPSRSVYDLSLQERVEEFYSRQYRFSFIGAHNPKYYLTHSRGWLNALEGTPESFILNRNEWHYEKRVYQEQIEGNPLEDSHLQIESQNAEEYKRVLGQSRFAPCPSGTGPNSIRLWEAIEFGCIPVLLADDLRLPGDLELWESACVILPETKEAVESMPGLLESLEKDRALIKSKLRSLEQIQRRYGKDSFITDIRNFAELVESSKSTEIIAGHVPTHRLYLSTQGAEDSDILQWLYLLHVIAECNGLKPVIYLDRELEGVDFREWPLKRLNVQAVTEHYPFLHDWRGEDRAAISDSCVLSKAMLDQFSCIRIQVKQPPVRINTSLFDSVQRLLSSESLLTETYEQLGEQAYGVSMLTSLVEWRPICTLVTSMFRGDEYLEGFLENSASLEQYETIEHLIARPNSPGREHCRLQDHIHDHDGAVYIWLCEDPGLYGVWNLLGRLGTSEYLSNFNIDDRRAPGHVTRLVSVLDQDPDVDVCSAALRVSTTKNLCWEESDDCEVWYASDSSRKYESRDLVIGRDGQVASCNMPHCMPVWRKSLHISNGEFDEARFGPSSDWEFWLRGGKHGFGFCLLGEPLGVYLKTDDSYWRRTDTTNAFDRAIVETYSDLSGDYRVPVDERPFGLRVAEMMNARDQRRIARYFWCLVDLHHCAKSRYGEFPALKRLLVSALKEDFAISGSEMFDSAASCQQPIEGIDDRLTHLVWLLVEGMSTTARHRGHLAPWQFRNITDFLGELGLSSDSMELDLLNAMAHKLVGKADVERYFLKKAYARDASRFWYSAQSVYRFSMSLEEICETLGGLPSFYRFEDINPGESLYFLPDYTQGNPYQRLLYQGLIRKGIKVQGLSKLSDLGVKTPSPIAGDVLHIHWVNYLYKGIAEAEYAQILEDFMDQLRDLNAQGIRIFWTVHNRYSHDLPNIELERVFRNELSRIADRVLVHHPCLLEQLSDWLHQDANVSFVEHGNYIGEYDNELDPAVARKSLGLEEDDTVISVIGQVRPYKSLYRYLPEFGEAMRRNKKLKLVIAGRVSCDRTLEAIEALPKEQVVLKNAFIADTDFQVYLNAASFVFLCYRDILTSGSLFQALSFGVPVLAPKLGSIPAYVVEGWNGFLYDAGAQAEARSLKLSLDYTFDTKALSSSALSTAMSVSWP